MFHDMLPDTARRLATECSQEVEKMATVKGKPSLVVIFYCSYTTTTTTCLFVPCLCVTNGPTTCALEGNHIPRQNKFKKSRERITFNPSPFFIVPQSISVFFGIRPFSGFLVVAWLFLLGLHTCGKPRNIPDKTSPKNSISSSLRWLVLERCTQTFWKNK